MVQSDPCGIAKLQTTTPDAPDMAFICFSSPERRSLAVVSLAADYKADRVCVFRIADEPNAEREINYREFCAAAEHVGLISELATKHFDPIVGVHALTTELGRLNTASGPVTVDVSTFPKNALLLTLRALELHPSVTHIRVVYTQPKEYVTKAYHTHSFGMRGTRVVPTFVAPYRPNEELVLVMLLGYEGDRAIGMWQRMQPHRTIAAIGKPTFQPQWEGLSERINAPLLATLDSRDVYHVDPLSPRAVYAFLSEALAPDTGTSRATENYFIAPLGTKPETVGVYLYCRDWPESATVVYAAPVNPQHQYIATGTGPSWILAEWDTLRKE